MQTGPLLGRSSRFIRDLTLIPRWEQARYPYAFQNPLGRCIGAKYGVVDESKISVLNTNVIPKPDGSGLWEMQYVNAFGNIVDPYFPNKVKGSQMLHFFMKSKLGEFNN